MFEEIREDFLGSDIEFKLILNLFFPRFLVKKSRTHDRFQEKES